MSPRVLELGQYIAPAYAGMLLAEQGYYVEKWVGPDREDPILGLLRGEELWEWINYRKFIKTKHAKNVVQLQNGEVDFIIDNLRRSAWEKWGINPKSEAERIGCVWVSLRDELGGRSFDAVAQARAWMRHTPYVPFYVGDTTAGLWMVFKATSALVNGHYVIGQSSALAKLVEGELMVDAVRGAHPPWDQPGTYGATEEGVEILYRGETVVEPIRDREWQLKNLHHLDGRITI